MEDPLSFISQPPQPTTHHLFTEYPAAVQQLGFLVPQSVYRAGSNFNQLPTIRFQDGGMPGITIGKAGRNETSQLAYAGLQPRMSDTAKKITLRINVGATDAYA